MLFGPFRLDGTRRTLRRDGHEVTLTARLFDTLLYLAQNPDRLVPRDELQSAVWGTRVVEAGNLQKAISELRKALQAEGVTGSIIVTVPGRGFRFALPVSFEPDNIANAQQDSLGELGGATPLAGDWTARLWRTQAALGIALATALVAGVAVAVVGRAGWHSAGQPPAFAPPPRSIAIMAFTNMSGDPGQDYMSDGIAEELIDALDRVGRLRVAARLSSFAFKGRQTPVSEVARQLNVGTVLEGSVRRDGTRLRVIARLIDASSGFQLWSRHYDRPWGDVLTTQEDIAQAVASALKVSLLDKDVAKLILGGSGNPKAMDAYLRGMHLMMGMDRRNFPAALAAFEEAVTADRNFALAYTGCAYAQADIAYDMGHPDSAPAAEMRHEARASANRAIALASGLAEAHAALAAVLTDVFLDPAGAVAEAGRAVALEPGSLSGQAQLAKALMDLGKLEESVAVAKHLTEMEPLLPNLWEVYAYVLYNARRYAEAANALGHVRALSGTLPPMAAGVLTSLELMTGDPGAAAANCLGGSQEIRRSMCLAIAYNALGRQDDARAQLAAAQSAANYTPYVGAVIFAQWGDPDRALDALQAAYAARDPKLEKLKVDPFLDPIRRTKRFADIARQLNFSVRN